METREDKLVLIMSGAYYGSVVPVEVLTIAQKMDHQWTVNRRHDAHSDQSFYLIHSREAHRLAKPQLIFDTPKEVTFEPIGQFCAV